MEVTLSWSIIEHDEGNEELAPIHVVVKLHQWELNVIVSTERAHKWGAKEFIDFFGLNQFSSICFFRGFFNSFFFKFLNF